MIEKSSNSVKFEKVLGVQFQVEEKSKIFILHFYYVKNSFYSYTIVDSISSLHDMS